jgi:hypothetical protein
MKRTLAQAFTAQELGEALQQKRRRFLAAPKSTTYTPRKRTLPPMRAGRTRVTGFYGRFQSGGEKKFHDVDLDDAAVATAGTITDSHVKIAQGTTESTRIGRKLTIRKINWRYDLRLNNSSEPSHGDVVRVILYVDHQCNGATAAVGDVLASADYQSFRNLANMTRFTILLDKTYNLQFSAGAYDGTNDQFSTVTQSYTFQKRCNIPVEYSSTTGAITEIKSNNIGSLLISRNGFGAFASKFRFRFDD